MIRNLSVCLLGVFLITFSLLELPNGIYFCIHHWSFHKHPPSLLHPIPGLMLRAEMRFQGMLARQSQSLEKAVVEYHRRYQRKPPKGFEEWYNFVRQNNVTIVDEYDAMMEQLEPFWVLKGEEFRKRVESVCFYFMG